MNLELFLAKKICFNKEEGQRMMPPAIRVALAGIALGMAVMILSVAIITGFRKEVRNKVIGFGSHIQITRLDSNSSYETLPVALDEPLLRTIRSHPGIRHADVFATKPGILKTDTDFQGIILKGVDENYNWSFFLRNLREGRLPDISAGKTSTEVIISQYLASLLKLKTGDTFLTYFVQDDVRARRFTITGLYETGFADYDKLFVLTDIRQIRRLNAWEDNEASGLELLADNYNHADRIAEDLFFALPGNADAKGNPLYVRSINDLNPMIFGWLDVLNTNVAVILILMLAVAGFTMISGLLIIILERIRMIGILKAMGQSNRSIRKVFLYIALFLTGKGMLWGNLTGIAVCLIQQTFRLFRLDPSTYYLDAVPIDLNPTYLLLLNAGTLLAILLMMLGPTRMIMHIQPARSIRFE